MIILAILTLFCRFGYSAECSSVFKSPSSAEKPSASAMLEDTRSRVNISSIQFSRPKGVHFVIRHKTLLEVGEKRLLLKAFLDHSTGTVKLEVSTRDANGAIVDPNIYANSLFEIMVEEFGIGSIKIIQAEWYWDIENPEAPNLLTNTIQFREKLSRGATMIDAAKQTWTGRMAARFGFTKVVVEGLEQYQIGPFMIVKFIRP